MLQKYGRLIALFLMLIVTTEVIIYFNTNIDSQLTSAQNENAVERLRNQISQENYESGLNPYREYWVYELEHFYKDYPAQQKAVFLNVDLKQWNTSFMNLVDKIESVHIDDVTFMSEVSDTIKQFISINYLQDIFDTSYEKGYFRSVMMLMEDDQKKQG